MDSLIQQATRMVDTFGQLMSNRALTEYEMLMYEQTCKMLEVHAKCMAIKYRINELELLRAEMQANRVHQKWLEKNSDPGRPTLREGESE